ncbi:MAG: hypothetical protein ACLFPD_11940 [Desulfosudaceae bacterium]
MSTPWKTSDLLDLDYFLQPSPDSSAAGDAADLADFDRAVYLASAQTHTPSFDRRDVIKYWLDEKRAGVAGHRALPGALFTETMSLMRILAVLTAFVFGAVLAWSVLSYSDTTPINIFTCLWIMIVPQLLLLFLLGRAALLSKMGVKSIFRGLSPLVVLLIQRLAARIGKTGQKAFPAAKSVRSSGKAGLTAGWDMSTKKRSAGFSRRFAKGTGTTSLTLPRR